MYASAARNLHVAGSPQDKLTVLDNLKQKLKTKRPLAIGNLILVDQSLNNELANKSFNEKRLLLQSANVWVDAAILNAFNWGAAEIEARTKLLAAEAYSNVWKI